jgi:hypothetical protein
MENTPLIFLPQEFYTEDSTLAAAKMLKKQKSLEKSTT